MGAVMALSPQIILDILTHSGSVRLSIKGLYPDVMKQYAVAAKTGGAFVEFVAGGANVFPEMLNDVSSAGEGHVRWDFVSHAE
jgi:hypothetical protein